MQDVNKSKQENQKLKSRINQLEQQLSEFQTQSTSNPSDLTLITPTKQTTSKTLKEEKEEEKEAIMIDHDRDKLNVQKKKRKDNKLPSVLMLPDNNYQASVPIPNDKTNESYINGKIVI